MMFGKWYRVRVYQTCYDGRLLDLGIDSLRPDESRIDAARRIRRSVGLDDKYTSLKRERWSYDDETGFWDLTFIR